MSDGETEAHRRAYEAGRYSCGCRWESRAGEAKRTRHFCPDHTPPRDVMVDTLTGDDPEALDRWIEETQGESDRR